MVNQIGGMSSGLLPIPSSFVPPTNKILPTIGSGGFIPGNQSLFSMGSPSSEVGRMKHTLSAHFGGMRNIPLPVLALVADSDAFRINNSTLQRGLKSSSAIDGMRMPYSAHEDPMTWAQEMIASRFSNVELERAAIIRHRAIVHHLYQLRMKDILDRAPVAPSPNNIETHLGRAMIFAEYGERFLRSAWASIGLSSESTAADYARYVFSKIDEPGFKAEDWADVAARLSDAAKLRKDPRLNDLVKIAGSIAAEASNAPPPVASTSLRTPVILELARSSEEAGLPEVAELFLESAKIFAGNRT